MGKKLRFNLTFSLKFRFYFRKKKQNFPYLTILKTEFFLMKRLLFRSKFRLSVLKNGKFRKLVLAKNRNSVKFTEKNSVFETYKYKEF